MRREEYSYRGISQLKESAYQWFAFDCFFWASVLREVSNVFWLAPSYARRDFLKRKNFEKMIANSIWFDWIGIMVSVCPLAACFYIVSNWIGSWLLLALKIGFS